MKLFYMFFGRSIAGQQVSHGAEAAITQRRFKVSRLNAMNDPFECVFAEIDHPLQSMINGTLRDVIEKTGMLCFSRRWNHPLMWSHYSSGHQGICIGFEYHGLPENMASVRYTEDRIEIPHHVMDALAAQVDAQAWIEEIGDDPDARRCVEAGEKALDELCGAVRDLMQNKHSDWKYEDEARIPVSLGNEEIGLEYEKDVFFKSWDEDGQPLFSVREVILGAKCPESFSDVNQWFGERRLPYVFRAKLEPRHYKLFRKREHT